METSLLIAAVSLVASIVGVVTSLAISRRARKTQLDVERLKFDLAQREKLASQLANLSARLESYHMALFQLTEHSRLASPAKDATETPLHRSKLEEVSQTYKALTAAWADCEGRLPQGALREYAQRMHINTSHTLTLHILAERLLEAELNADSREESIRSMEEAYSKVFLETTELDRLIRAELRLVAAPSRYAA